MSKRIALIVGVNNYDDPLITSLTGAINDASDLNGFFRRALPESERFDTTLLTDPTASEVVTTLSQILARLSDDSTFFFYFAGHGISVGNSDRQKLLCRDATSLTVQDIVDLGSLSPEIFTHISRQGRGNMFFCFDACRSSAVAGRGSNTSNGSDKFRDAVSSIGTTTLANRWALSSCLDGQIAGDQGNFVRSIVEVMKDGLKNEGCVHLGDAFVSQIATKMSSSNPTFLQRPVASGSPFVLVGIGSVEQFSKPVESERSAVIQCQQNPPFYHEDSGDFSINMRRNDNSAETISKKTDEIDNPQNIVVSQFFVDRFEIVPETVKPERTVIHLPSQGVELPPFPEELDQLRAELLGINRALVNFGEKVETVTSRAREVVRQAKEQLDSIEEKRNILWDKMGLSPETRIGLEEALENNPWVTLNDVFNLKPTELTTAEFGFCFDVEKKRLEAERIADAVSKRFTALIAAQRKNLIDGRKTAKSNYMSQVDQFCQDTIDSVLKTCPGYEQGIADLPEEYLSGILLPYFDDCHFTFTDDFLWDTIRKRWEARLSTNSWNYAIKAGTYNFLNIDGIEYAFRYCPAGRYTIGSPESEAERFSDETQHDVIFSYGYWMLETQVTQLMWEKVMGHNPSSFKGGNRPVEWVSWDDCQEFIQKLNTKGVAPSGWVFSLPTEAEWEVAARAGSTTAFPWGNILTGYKAKCNGKYPYGTTVKDKCSRKTCAVKSYSPNAWGLYDTVGNVAEWCLDKYGDYPETVETDYVGKSGSSRVVRGGSWDSRAKCCRSAYRGYYSSYRNNLGFRCSLARALVRQQQLQ